MSELQREQQQFAAQLAARQAFVAIDDLFRGQVDQVERRFAVYRGNIIANQLKALRGAYPVIEQLVGKEFFEGLAREYGNQVPSVSGDLNDFGSAFSNFLEQFSHTRDLSFLPDIGNLEWLVHRAFYAANRDPLDAARLAQVPLEDQAQLRFVLHPAVAVMHSKYPVARLWEIHQEDFAGTFEIGDTDSGGWVLVSRPRFHALVGKVAPAAAAFLGALVQDLDLAVALARAQSIDNDFNLGDWLARWISTGVIVDFTIRGQEHGRFV